MTRRTLIAIAITALVGAAPARAAEGGVLVFGGTGKLGSEIVKLLAAAGDEVTVFARPGSNRDRLAGLNIDYAVGDMLDGASVAAAFDAKRYRAVIDASGLTEGQRGDPGNRDTKGFYAATMRNMATHAARTGVGQFILHGSVLAGDNIDLFPQFAFIKGSPTLIDKGNAERVLIDSGVPYCIIRHGRVPADPQPPPTGQSWLSTDQSIFDDMTRADLAMLTLDCLDNPARMGKIFHATDPVYTIDRPLPAGPGDLRNRRRREGAPQ
jgi:uncharacterized protein YbjT (DUF2867 family)